MQSLFEKEWPIRSALIAGFSSMKRLEWKSKVVVFLFPLEGILVHCWVPIYTPGWREELCE